MTEHAHRLSFLPPGDWYSKHGPWCSCLPTLDPADKCCGEFSAPCQRGWVVSFKVPIVRGNEPRQEQGGDLTLSPLSSFPLQHLAKCHQVFGVLYKLSLVARAFKVECMLVTAGGAISASYHWMVQLQHHASKGHPGVGIREKLIPSLGWKEPSEVTWSISMPSGKWRFYSLSKTRNY